MICLFTQTFDVTRLSKTSAKIKRKKANSPPKKEEVASVENGEKVVHSILNPRPALHMYWHETWLRSGFVFESKRNGIFESRSSADRDGRGRNAPVMFFVVLWCDVILIWDNFLQDKTIWVCNSLSLIIGLLINPGYVICVKLVKLKVTITLETVVTSDVELVEE